MIVPSTTYEVAETYAFEKLAGLYVLCEGNMGSNKASLDFLDFETGRYHRNIYSERNPDQVKELGDVGMDVIIHGSRLYCVVNCSHKVEVLRADDARFLGRIPIDNPRYLVGLGDRVYVSSYVGAVGSWSSCPPGAVVAIDTASLTECGSCTVSYQPDGLTTHRGILYTTNSGGYRPPDYDSVISSIDPTTMQETGRIHVEKNIYRLGMDSQGKMWVNTRGDYFDLPSGLFCLEEEDERFQLTHRLDIPCLGFAFHGDTLLYFSVEWSATESRNTISYGMLSTSTLSPIEEEVTVDGKTTRRPVQFIADPEVRRSIKVPYGLTVNPENGDIYVADATNYTSSGELLCFTSRGELKWRVPTGDIPSRFAFLYKKEYRQP